MIQELRIVLTTSKVSRLTVEISTAERARPTRAFRANVFTKFFDWKARYTSYPRGRWTIQQGLCGQSNPAKLIINPLEAKYMRDGSCSPHRAKLKRLFSLMLRVSCLIEIWIGSHLLQGLLSTPAKMQSKVCLASCAF